MDKIKLDIRYNEREMDKLKKDIAELERDFIFVINEKAKSKIANLIEINKNRQEQIEFKLFKLNKKLRGENPFE